MPSKKKTPKSSTPFSKETVKRAKALLKEEATHNQRSKEALIKSTICAYRIGKLIQTEVITKYGKDSMGAFAKQIGVTAQTARNYHYLARGLANEKLIRKFHFLNRDYFRCLGRMIEWNVDLPGNYLHYCLLRYPVMKEMKDTGRRKPDVDQISEISRLLKETRRILKEDLNIYYAFKKSNYMNFYRDDDRDKFKVQPKTEDKNIADDGWNECAILFYEVAKMVGPDWESVQKRFKHVTKKRKTKESARHTKQISKGDTAKKILYEKKRQKLITSTAKTSSKSELLTTDAKVFKGKSQEVLKDKTKFPERSVDVVITDPPYSDEYYDPWRDDNKVTHHAEKTTKEQAKLVGDIANTLVKRRIIKKQFTWFNFCPIDLVHEFLPAILKAFKDEKFIYQVLVWDKQRTPKVGGHSFFGRQAEAIIYVSVNRPLGTLEKNGKTRYLHSNIFSSRVGNQAGKNYSWKPVELLEELIKLSAYDTKGKEAQNQVILDVFAGSGSTGVASINCNRDFRLIESHPEQYKLAKASVLKAMKNKSK